MAFIVEVYPNHQLDFSIDPERLCDLLDQMVADGEVNIIYNDDDNEYEPAIEICELPAILERLKFTLLPEKKHGELLLSLFAPQPIRMKIVKRKEIQPHVTSSSSG